MPKRRLSNTRSKLKLILWVSFVFNVVFLMRAFQATTTRELPLTIGEKDILTNISIKGKTRPIVENITDAVLYTRTTFNKTRLLCWVMTCPDNLDKKAVHVRNTWGRRCDTLIFVSSKTNDTFPTIGFNIKEGREYLTTKTLRAFRYIFENNYDDADWFLKADDDTYVIVENLRYFLSEKNASEPVYFGHPLIPHVRQNYFCGGGGYVISKEALRRYGTRQKEFVPCYYESGNEDVHFGLCMENLGVKVGDSLDHEGRSRFHCLRPVAHIQGDFPNWYKGFDAYDAMGGTENISRYAISFHYMKPEDMYEMELFLYHVRPFEDG